MSAVRRTRIVCTLGPASANSAVLKRMIGVGMDVARLNFSHGDHLTHRREVGMVRAVAQIARRPVAILQDLQGPKVRTGNLTGGRVRLQRGQLVKLTAEKVIGDATLIPVTHAELTRVLNKGDHVLLADGEMELRVRRRVGEDLECVVVRGGELQERKGVVVPGANLGLPALTDKDKADLALGAELEVDYVALSFVAGPEDIEACREEMRRLNWEAPIIAKIERRVALPQIDHILRVANGVMVARGDLGVEMPQGDVPAIQKDIIARAHRAGVPVITATEMLESMVMSTRPTRAEAADVANAIWDGTDAVMLSQETSVGEYPVEALRAMSLICTAAEAHEAYFREMPTFVERDSVGGAIALAAAAVADGLRVRAIIAFTESGSTALRVSKARPRVPVLVASPHPRTLRKSQLYSGAIPLHVEPGHDTDSMIEIATRAALDSGLVRRGDRVVLVAGVPVGQAGRTNLLKVATVE